MEPIVTALNPLFMDKVSAMNNEARARKLIGGVFCGLRNATEVARLYAIGRTVVNPDGDGVTKNKPLGDTVTNVSDPMTTWHFFGLAVDWVFKDEKGNWTWNGMPQVFKNEMTGLWKWNRDLDNKWHELGKVGTMFGLHWAGYWERVKPDFPHFEMIGDLKNVHEAKDIFLAQGIEAVWKRAEMIL